MKKIWSWYKNRVLSCPNGKIAETLKAAYLYQVALFVLFVLFYNVVQPTGVFFWCILAIAFILELDASATIILLKNEVKRNASQEKTK